MFKTNLAFKISNQSWNLPEWEYLVSEVSSVFKLTTKENSKLRNSYTAKIIATIPFEAGCNEPERTAIAHLCLYIAEIKGFQKFCSHNVQDDENIYNRLAFISTFDGGNLEIINHGMSILALIMLEGYKSSCSKDKKANIYNPLVSGKWNYQNEKNKLLWEIGKIEVPNLDWIFAEKTINYWS